MLKVLAGDLSATFNIDGQHLERYVNRQVPVVRSLCDQLLLHDQILVPTQDYLTAAGLIRILGERNFLVLLEEERLRFLRLRGFFGYVRGTGPDGRLVAMDDPTRTKAISSPIDQSIESSLRVIKSEYTEHNRLIKTLIACSHELELQRVIDSTHMDAYADLSRTVLWKEEYRFSNPDLLALPGMKEMQVRVIGPGTDVSNNVVDACLALGLMNIELYLAKQFDCASSSTGSPMGDCISLKLPRLTGDYPVPQKLWSFLDVAGIPDISGPLLADREEMAKFLKLTRHRDAGAFRQWFHRNADLTEKEILKAYIDVLHQTPWIQGKGGRALRMATSLGLGVFGLGWIVDAAVSAVDNFVVDKFIRGKGAKFFIEDLRKFSGRIVPRY